MKDEKRPRNRTHRLPGDVPPARDAELRSLKLEQDYRFYAMQRLISHFNSLGRIYDS